MPIDWITPVDRLPTVPGGWLFEAHGIADRTVQLTRPRNPDAFLEDPEILAANQHDDSMPYWTDLWPSSLMMAEFVNAHVFPGPSRTVLELGCGIGLVGLALLCRGTHVVFSDSDSTAVQLALWNAGQNGFDQQVRFRGCLIDWFRPPKMRFDTMIANDVLYEARLHEPLLSTAASMLDAEGRFWIGDPGRHVALDFLELAEDSGWEFRVHEPGPRLSVFELRRG